MCFFRNMEKITLLYFLDMTYYCDRCGNYRLETGIFMNKRTVAMIHELADGKGPHTLQSLAEQFDVSQRTIRNDIKEIDRRL